MASLYILSRINAMRRISRTASRDQSCVCSVQRITVVNALCALLQVFQQTRVDSGCGDHSFSQKLTVLAAWLHLASESGSQWSLLSVKSTSLKSRRGAAPLACVCPGSAARLSDVGEASTVKPTVCTGEKCGFIVAGGAHDE